MITSHRKKDVQLLYIANLATLTEWHKPFVKDDLKRG